MSMFVSRLTSDERKRTRWYFAHFFFISYCANWIQSNVLFHFQISTFSPFLPLNMKLCGSKAGRYFFPTKFVLHFQVQKKKIGSPFHLCEQWIPNKKPIINLTMLTTVLLRIEINQLPLVLCVYIFPHFRNHECHS